MSTSTYTFVAWLRQGIANFVQPGASATANSIRATLTASLSVESPAGQAVTPPVTMNLIGPGDILGIDARQVIRTEPRHGTASFENNYLAAIDFYDEDFPWRYSPISPDSNTHRLAPWLVLAVLKPEEFEMNNTATGTSSLTLSETARKENIFPVSGQEWAWAHVHFNQRLNSSGTVPDLDQIRTLLNANPDVAYSRILCPRQLEPNTSYCAFLLPAFEVGRRAGLGETLAETDNGLARSWEGTANVFPIYYQWTFRTGAGGDFESLIRNLVPRDMDPKVGVRDLDISDPGFGMDGMTNAPDNTVGLEGALLAPTSVQRGLAAGSDFVPKIAPILNSAAEAVDIGSQDPVVAPPIYGCWPARVQRVMTQGQHAVWVDQLNLDPRYRAAAGLGARVFRAHQDEYLQSAWTQMGDILSLNARIRRAQLASRAAAAAYAKSVVPLPAERVVSLLAPTLARVRSGTMTLAAVVRNSVATRATFSMSLAKQLRPRGRIARYLFPAESRHAALAGIVGGLSQGRVSAALARPPAGGATLESINAEILQSSPPAGAAVSGPTPAQLGEVANLLSGAWLGPAAVASTPSRSHFQYKGNPNDVTLPASSRPAQGRRLNPDDSLAGADMRTALSNFQDQLSIHVTPTPPKPILDLLPVRQQALASTEPQAAFKARFGPLLRMGATDVLTYARTRYLSGANTDPVFPEVMAYPDIKEPMCGPLIEISSEYLLPNLKLIPDNTLSLLKTNQAFIESYLVGLNHEFARELLWNEFPTDQQGSYFRQFWDASSFVDRENRDPQTLAQGLKDIPPLHQWDAASSLGSHDNRRPQSDAGPTVLVLRGELLMRYPNTFIYAQKAAWGTGALANRLVLSDPTGALMETSPQDPRLKFPLYKAVVPGDIFLFGLDLTLEEMRGDPRLDETADARAVVGEDIGWFIVLQQAVGEPRFGLDSAPPVDSAPLVWDNLSWQNLQITADGIIDVAKGFVLPPAGTGSGGLTWGSNSADMASILYQEPSMVAVHGRNMLRKLNSGS